MMNSGRSQYRPGTPLDGMYVAAVSEASVRGQVKGDMILPAVYNTVRLMMQNPNVGPDVRKHAGLACAALIEMFQGDGHISPKARSHVFKDEKACRIGHTVMHPEKGVLDHVDDLMRQRNFHYSGHNDYLRYQHGGLRG